MWQFQNFIECLSLGGVPKILLERGDNPDVEIRGLPLFYYFTVQLHLLCVWEKSFLYKILILQSLEFAMQDSHHSVYSTKTLYHFYISDSRKC